MSDSVSTQRPTARRGARYEAGLRSIYRRCGRGLPTASDDGSVAGGWEQVWAASAVLANWLTANASRVGTCELVVVLGSGCDVHTMRKLACLIFFVRSKVWAGSDRGRVRGGAPRGD